MPEGRPKPWEALYPPGLDWGTPIQTMPLPELLAEAVSSYRDRFAFEFNDRRIRFGTFGEEVAEAARGLAALGVRPGRAVALYLPNLLYHPIAFFAVLAAGGRVVHLSPLDAIRTLAYKITDSGADILITANLPSLLANAERLRQEKRLAHLIIGRADAWGPLGIELGPLPDGAIDFSELSRLGQGERLPPPPDDEDVAVLQYTGGTTGLPKAAMLTHANLSAACEIYRLWQTHNGSPLREGDKIIGVLP